MYILGISAFYHDSAACIINNGEIIAAAQEERFSRIKHDSSFPHLSINYCCKEANIQSNQITNIVFYEKPFSKFERLLETYLAFVPKGFKSFALAMPIWIKEKLFLKSVLIKELKKNLGKNINLDNKILFSEHHLSHAASSFYPSPFNEAAILTLDGVGEWTTTSIMVGKANDLKSMKEINFPHSLGLLYSAFTYYLGFKVNSGEYKVMGLAPYGEPKFLNLIKSKLVKVLSDGSFKLNMKYFDFATGLKMTNNKFNKLFDGPPRKPESKLTQRDMDIAASIQKAIEEIIVSIASNIAKETKCKNLCLAGGVALNCVANGVLLKNNLFENIWIQPSSGDAGGAIGAALGAWHIHHKKPREVNKKIDSMKGSFLGPKFTDDVIRQTFEECDAKYHYYSDDEIFEKVSKALINQKAIGYMQGRMEFGPRALGGRSIIADPRSSTMQKNLNLKVKFRESFRPFAPSILHEYCNEWFDLEVDSPYMLQVADIKKNKKIDISDSEKKLFGIEKLNVVRSVVPAITHVNYSARIQTVHKKTNRKFYEIINKFYEKTGCPMIVNTSFNVRGEPIVCSPLDAFRCFMGTDLDLLVVENFLLIKDEQNKELLEKYEQKYDLD